MAYDNSDTHRLISSLNALRAYTVQPYPLVYLTEEAQERVNAIQLELGAYAETTMLRFVTGDIALTDENWDAYVNKLDDLGLQEMIDIWQSALQ